MSDDWGGWSPTLNQDDVFFLLDLLFEMLYVPVLAAPGIGPVWEGDWMGATCLEGGLD